MSETGRGTGGKSGVGEGRASTTRRRVIDAFRTEHGTSPAFLVRAPGRVNLLGAHVDYNEGHVLPAAIDRDVWLAAGPSRAATVRVRSLDFDETARLELDSLDATRPVSSWLAYPAGVAWALRSSGHDPVGMRAVLAGDVPIGAGLSSSAAVEVAFLLAWEALSGVRLEGAEGAVLCRRAENEYVGVASGIMDQYACLHGAAGQLVLLDCRTLTHEHVPLPEDTAILVADTGIRRALAASDYNARPGECAEALVRLARRLPGLRALRDLEMAELDRWEGELSPTLRRRARHVVEECARVRRGAEALLRGDLRSFGEEVRRSHESSRDLYEVSIPELNVLADAAWEAEGCFGARLTGAGFGGCVVTLVARSAASAVESAMVSAYREEFGRAPTVFACRSAAGAAVEVL